MQVRISKMIKSPTQSGENNRKEWCLKFISSNNSRYLEPFLYRLASYDMMPSELILKFSNEAEAVNFAIKNNFNYEVITPKLKKINKKNYADNFK